MLSLLFTPTHTLVYVHAHTCAQPHLQETLVPMSRWRLVRRNIHCMEQLQVGHQPGPSHSSLPENPHQSRLALLSSAREDLPCHPSLNLPLAEQFSCFLLLLKLLWALPPPDLPSNPTTYVKLFSKARIVCPLRGMLLSAVKIMKIPLLLHI